MYCGKDFMTFGWQVQKGKGNCCSLSCACKLGNKKALKPRYSKFSALNGHLKDKVSRQLHRAYKSGKIERQPCEICGAPDALAHHEDYSKPFDIKWLCTKHHSERHLQGLHT